MAFFIMLVKNKKIFLSPLDWGLGHTTRCIPIINSLQKLGAKVYLGVNEEQRSLLEQEVDNCEFIHFDGYKIVYPTGKSMALKMAIQTPKILTAIANEKKTLNLLIEKYNFDLIISDNRFGLYSNKVPSVYITHQINIQAPIAVNKVLFKIHKKLIENHTQCWIPDCKEDKNALSGKLSRNSKESNYFYINTLSRFETPCLTSRIEYQYLAIISGPEPQRSIFENEITLYFKTLSYRCAIVGGKPTENLKQSNTNIDYYSHLNSIKLYELLNVSNRVVSRPGYSSIMDFCVLQKPIVFIPTPGQTEQEYLGKYYLKKYGIEFTSQNKMRRRLNKMNFNTLPYHQNQNLTATLKDALNKI